MTSDSISVIIPTHQRPQKLRTLVSSLHDAKVPEIEKIVVVDDTGTGSGLQTEFPDLPLDIVALTDRVFVSRAKNIGWRRSTSDLIYFIDDDNVVTQETIRVPVSTIVAHPEAGAIVPAVLYRRRPDLVWVYATPWAPGRWGHSLVGRNRPRDAGLEAKLYDTDALPNASLVRRSALLQIHGFREDLVVNSSADAALRLKRAGWAVYADTGAFIYHDVEPPGRVGSWAEHGIADPQRVYHEIRDWFSLMRSLHSDEAFFSLRATWHALGFMLPNSLSYAMRGGGRGRESLKQLVRGYLSSLRSPPVSDPR